MLEPPGLQRALDRLARRHANDPHDREVRLVVRARARDACEYCLMPASSQFHIDHIVPTSQWPTVREESQQTVSVSGDRGPQHLDNFAWSCPFCNAFKGSAVAGQIGGQEYPLFHPRRDIWSEHFVLTDRNLLIVGLTEIGQATEQVLRLNDARPNGPLAVRHAAIVDGLYPPVWARTWGM